MSGLLRAVMLYYMKRPAARAAICRVLLRAVMLWYYKKRPGICRDYSGLWCYDIIWSGQVYVGITPGCDVMIYKKRPGICRDYSGLWCYDIIWSGIYQVYVSYDQRPGITPGLWCYNIIWSGQVCRHILRCWSYNITWSDQVYVGITPGCDVMILYEATRYMSGLLRVIL